MFAEKEFEEVMRRLHDAGVLGRIVLAGSWCQVVYRDNGIENIPTLRTQDLDLFISPPPETGPDVNVHELLISMGYEVDFKYNEAEKYIKDTNEIEFITRTGRREGVLNFKSMHIKAGTVKYTELLERYVCEMNYAGITITLPEPLAFAFHKIHISTKRRSQDKAMKDRQAGISIVESILENDSKIVRARQILESMPKSGQIAVKKVIEEYPPTGFDISLLF